MKDKVFVDGIIKTVDISAKENKHYFGIRKLFRDYLTKLNVIFFDGCCDNEDTVRFPLTYNTETDTTQYYNGTEWVDVP